MPDSSPELSPTLTGPVEGPQSPAQTDFTDVQLKPAPLRLTRKSNSSGGQSDNSLCRSNSSTGRTPNRANPANRESLNTIIHRTATPSTFRTAHSQTAQTTPKLASLVSKFEILDVMGSTDTGALRLPSPEKTQKPPRAPTPTPDEGKFRRATKCQSQLLAENVSSHKQANVSLPRSSLAQRRAPPKGVGSDSKTPTANALNHCDTSGVAERRRLFESGSTVPRPFDSPIVTPVVTRTVARVPSQGEQKRASEVVNTIQRPTISGRRSVTAQSSAPSLSSPQSATETTGPARERRKSVAALRMSFERSSLPGLQPETPSSTRRPFRRTLTHGLSISTEVPTPVTPKRGANDPITPTRVRTLRSSEVFAQTFPRLGQPTNQSVHGSDSNASSRLKQNQLYNTASRVVGSLDGNNSDAEADTHRPVSRKNSDTPTRPSARTSTRRSSSQHPLLLSRTLSVKVTAGPHTMITLQQPWATSSGSLPLTTSHSHSHQDRRKSKSGGSSDSATSAPLAPANRVKDLQKVFDANPTGPGSAPFLPFIQRRRAQTLTVGVPAKSSLSAPIMVSTTVAVTTRKASRRSSLQQQQQQQQQQRSSDLIPETASSNSSSVVGTRKRSKTLPSSLGGYRRKSSGGLAGAGSSAYTGYFQRRKIKKQQKQDMKKLATGEDSPVKERISLFEQLGGGRNSHGHTRNGGNGCGSIVSLPLSIHSKRKSSETTSSSQGRSERSSGDTDRAGFGKRGRGSSSSGSRVMRVLSFGTKGDGNSSRSSRNSKVLRAAGRKISNAVSMSMSISKRRVSGAGGEGKGKGKAKAKDSDESYEQPLVLSSTNKETGESTFLVKGVLWRVSGSHGDLDLNVAVADGETSPEREERRRDQRTTETTTTSFPSTESGSGSGSSGSAGAMARHPVLQQWPHLDKVSRTVPHRHDRKAQGSLSVEVDSTSPEGSQCLDNDDDPFLQSSRPAGIGGSNGKIKKSTTVPDDVGIMCRKRGFIPARRSHGDVVEAARGPSTSLRKSFTMAVLPRLSSGNSSTDDPLCDSEGKQKGNKLTKEKGKDIPIRQSSISWGQKAAAAAFGIGQRLKERKGSSRSASLLGMGVETGTGGNSSANSDIAVAAAATSAAVPIPISAITTESLRHDE